MPEVRFVSQSALLMGRLSKSQLLATHQYQRDGTQSTPNDCTVASIAMTINQALLQVQALGFPGAPLQYGWLARWMDHIPFLYRIPAWFPKIGEMDGRGATPPWGATWVLNYFARQVRKYGTQHAWKARRSSGNTPQDLQLSLTMGYPTLLFGVWQNGYIPHAIVVAGYQPAEDTYLMLDPGSPVENPHTGKRNFHYWTRKELLAWWKGWNLELGISIPIYRDGTMIVLEIDK